MRDATQGPNNFHFCFCFYNTIIYLVSFYIFLRLPEAPDTVWDQYHHPYVLDRDTQIDFIKFIAAEAQ